MSNISVIIPITIIGYLIMMIVIGILYSKKNKSVSDFYLGGRQLGPLVTAMSAEASDIPQDNGDVKEITMQECCISLDNTALMMYNRYMIRTEMVSAPDAAS